MQALHQPLPLPLSLHLAAATATANLHPPLLRTSPLHQPRSTKPFSSFSQYKLKSSPKSLPTSNPSPDFNSNQECQNQEEIEENPLESAPMHQETNGEIEVEIEKIGNNCRRIQSRVAVDASLEILWKILTDYERLADFIPGLAVSQLLEKRGNLARLFQIGQQNLALGLKFNAKGILDCYEKDLEIVPFGHRRDIEFKMIEGDFKLFEGKWSIEQRESAGFLVESNCKFVTTLLYVVDVEPKLWLPVGVVQGRICSEIKTNLLCIKALAQKAVHSAS